MTSFTILTMTPHEPLETILSGFGIETRAALVNRRQNAFDIETGELSRSLILFGAGNLGKQTARGLEEVGLPPLFFADNNPATWGTKVEGIEVLPTSAAARLYADKACFVVTVYNGSTPRKQLRKLGCRSVVSYVPLFWKY